MTKPKELKTDKPFLLVLGNDFLHKNRDFAIKVWQKLLDQGHSIDLVLAGLHVKSSSSKKQEQELIDKHVNLRGSVHTLGHVTSNERAWLLSNTEAVLYPSSAEGFGFVPHEAAALGSPSAFVAFGPLLEVSQLMWLPSEWTVKQIAMDVGELLSESESVRRRVTQLETIVKQLSWISFSKELTNFFGKIGGLGITPVASMDPASIVDSVALAQVLNSKSWRLTAPLRIRKGKGK